MASRSACLQPAARGRPALHSSSLTRTGLPRNHPSLPSSRAAAPCRTSLRPTAILSGTSSSPVPNPHSPALAPASAASLPASSSARYASPALASQPHAPTSSLSSPSTIASFAALAGGALLLVAACHSAHVPIPDGARLLAHSRPAWTFLVGSGTHAAQELAHGYNRWLEEDPLVCKIVTGNFFTAAGDLLAQLGTGCSAAGHGEAAEQQEGGIGEGKAAAAPASAAGRPVDWARTARLCAETSAFGTPAAHYWFGFLDSHIYPDAPHSAAAVLSKTALDQLCFVPLGLLAFFAIVKTLEGRPGDLPATLRKSYVKSLLGGYLLWPAAGIINFALVPAPYRLLFLNCVNVLWTAFLSIMSSGGQESEEAQQHATAAPAAPAPSAAAATAAAAAASPSSASLQPPPAAAANQTNHHVIEDVLVAAVTVAALSISLSSCSQPSFATVTGLAVGVIETAFVAHSLRHEVVGATATTAPSLEAVETVERLECAASGVASGPVSTADGC